jgi:hypothetical protein
MAQCSGYFDEEGLVLACATKRQDFVSVLVHEYCHLKQWAENCDIWKKVQKSNSHYHLGRWLDGERVSNIKKHLALCRDLELDNEKRSVQLIKELDLNIDVPTYVKKANAYVQFYNHMYYTRSWCNSTNSPYIVKDIYENMPSKFNMSYKRMSAKVKRVFDKVYLVK